ncbi:3-hydroxy-3-methylglutaryl-coenzyme A reductase [Spatholobus suberectus]|nr:3-hydroxy-3-methylglutaryl-coenzyme A reductase [Spatholobus suberectus]
MGKNEQQQHVQEEGQGGGSEMEGPPCWFLLRAFSFKCLFLLLLSLSALVSALFWVLPRHTTTYSFDAKDVIKQSASVQTSFRLEKPVSQLIPYIETLEYDIYGEIALPNTKVAILSMHQSITPNCTDVVFGVLSDPMNASINPVSLSVLRSSLIELFLQQSNLTLTTSIFGNASIFEMLKFPGGITVIPVQSASIWQIPEILFNFTLNNSISEVLDNFDDFKDELKFGLHLNSDENVYVQITNANGSTIAPPVVVQASVMPGFGSLLPQRLKQLAQTITGSAGKNLGLDNSVFGRVKEVRLSSFLKNTLHATSPSPSPAPSPQLIDHSEPSTSPHARPHSPISPATAEQPPCFNCEVSSPAPSIVPEHPPDPCPYNGFVHHPIPSPKSYSKPSFPPDYPPAAAPSTNSASHTTEEASDLSRVAKVSHGSKLRQGEETSKKLVSQILAPSSLSSAGGDFRREILLMGFCMLLISFVFLNDTTF